MNNFKNLATLSTADLEAVNGGLSYLVFPIDRYPIDYPTTDPVHPTDFQDMVTGF